MKKHHYLLGGLALLAVGAVLLKGHGKPSLFINATGDCGCGGHSNATGDCGCKEEHSSFFGGRPKGRPNGRLQLYSQDLLNSYNTAYDKALHIIPQSI